MLTRNDFYFCYSGKLAKYLEEKGIKYLFMFLEQKSKAPVSIYEMTETLSKALTEYKLNK